MDKKHIRSWKKVLEPDLSYIAYEIKELSNKPALLFLEGNLGVGKTTFSKIFIGDEDSTQSPSYSVLYECKDFLHGDFYRIKEREEIFHLEIGLYLEDKNYFLIEWGIEHINEIYDEIYNEISQDFQLYLIQIDLSSEQKSKLSVEQAREFTLHEIQMPF